MSYVNVSVKMYVIVCVVFKFKCTHNVFREMFPLLQCTMAYPRYYKVDLWSASLIITSYVGCMLP